MSTRPTHSGIDSDDELLKTFESMRRDDLLIFADALRLDLEKADEKQSPRLRAFAERRLRLVVQVLARPG